MELLSRQFIGLLKKCSMQCDMDTTTTEFDRLKFLYIFFLLVIMSTQTRPHTADRTQPEIEQNSWKETPSAIFVYTYNVQT